MSGAPLDPSEPPNGDFARYIEQIERAQQAATQGARPARPAQAVQSAEAADRAAGSAHGREQAGADAAWGRTPEAPGAPARTAGRRRQPLPAEAAATLGRFVDRFTLWIIVAGAGLFLLAVLPERPMFVGSPFPGLFLIGVGIALRNRFARKHQR